MVYVTGLFAVVLAIIAWRSKGAVRWFLAAACAVNLVACIAGLSSDYPYAFRLIPNHVADEMDR